MKIKKKSLNLKKFKIANLNQKFIYGGTVATLVTCPDSQPPACYLHSVPIIGCTSQGHLKSLERVGSECKPAIVDSHEPSDSQDC